MIYHGFYIKITPQNNLRREKKDGSIAICKGYRIEIFSDVTKEITVDVFTAAVGFEILHDTIDEAEQFAKDVIDSEEKEYLRMIQEFTH